MHKGPDWLAKRVALVKLYNHNEKAGACATSPMGPWWGRVPKEGGTGQYELGT